MISCYIKPFRESSSGTVFWPAFNTIVSFYSSLQKSKDKNTNAKKNWRWGQNKGLKHTAAQPHQFGRDCVTIGPNQYSFQK